MPTSASRAHRTIGSRHAYHVSPLRQLIPWMLFLPLAGGLAIGALLSDTPGDAAALWMGSTAFAVVLLGIFWMIRHARLDIGPDGVVLRQIGYRFETPWTNIIAMRVDRGHESFVTAQPVGGKGASTVAAAASISPYALYDSEQQALIEEHRLIPFEAFAWHLRNGMLVREIRRFAPHLASDLAQLDGRVAASRSASAPTSASASTSPEPKTKPDARSRWAMAATIAISLAFTGVMILIGERYAALVINTIYALLDPFLIASSAAATWQMVKRRSLLFTVLMGLMTLVMIGWTILDWSRLLG